MFYRKNTSLMFSCYGRKANILLVEQSATIRLPLLPAKEIEEENLYNWTIVKEIHE